MCQEVKRSCAWGRGRLTAQWRHYCFASLELLIALWGWCPFKKWGCSVVALSGCYFNAAAQSLCSFICWNNWLLWFRFALQAVKGRKASCKASCLAFVLQLSVLALQESWLFLTNATQIIITPAPDAGKSSVVEVNQKACRNDGLNGGYSSRWVALRSN